MYQDEILAEVQRIKDEQKQKYIREQAEIIINFEKYEALSQEEKDRLYYRYLICHERTSPSQGMKMFLKEYPFMWNIIDKVKVKIFEFKDDFIRKNQNL